jgi:hypothetical protein
VRQAGIGVREGASGVVGRVRAPGPLPTSLANAILLRCLIFCNLAISSTALNKGASNDGATQTLGTIRRRAGQYARDGTLISEGVKRRDGKFTGRTCEAIQVGYVVSQHLLFGTKVLQLFIFPYLTIVLPLPRISFSRKSHHDAAGASTIHEALDP